MRPKTNNALRSKTDLSLKVRNKVPTSGSPLAGRFFYTVIDGVIRYQGQIIAHLKEGSACHLGGTS